MNTNITKFNVAVFGETYHLASDESQEVIFAAAEHIDNLMRQIARDTGLLDARRIAVLAALQMSLKVQELHLRHEQAHKEYARLAQLIDAGF